MNLLDDLFFKYHADKTPRIKHHYSDVYYDLFKDRRESVKKVCEIGTAEGASLFAWREFFPNATIYGGEIDQKRVDLMKEQDRIQVFKCDQSSVKDLGDLLEKIGFDVDLFVDDGSHKPEDQLLSCLTLMPFFKQDCIYVIEDVDDERIADFLRNKYQVSVLTVGKRHDDRLIIVRHEVRNIDMIE